MSLPGEAMVGTRPLTAATACDAYGGDAKGNGLCDDWEKPLPKTMVAGKDPTRCGSLVLTKVTTPDGKSIRVTFAGTGIPAGQGASFSVHRSATPEVDLSKPPVWKEMVSIGRTPGGGNGDVVIAHGLDLKPDPLRPFIVVEATSNGVKTSKSCEQPGSTWLPRHSDPQPSGLHGPYDSVDEATTKAAPIAMAKTIEASPKI